MDRRIGTYTGKLVDPLDLKPEDVDIQDIARSLSQKCRWGGHSKRFLSVAQHCIAGSLVITDPYALAFLLHDAAETWLGDGARPMKKITYYLSNPSINVTNLDSKEPEFIGAGSDYQAMAETEQRMLEIIMGKFGVMWTDDVHEAVDDVDSWLLAMEAPHFMPGHNWSHLPQYAGDYSSVLMMPPLEPEEAMHLFLKRFEQLSAGRG